MPPDLGRHRTPQIAETEGAIGVLWIDVAQQAGRFPIRGEELHERVRIEARLEL